MAASHDDGESLVWECTPHDKDAMDLAAEMMDRYAILDVGYFPNMHCLTRHFSRESIHQDRMKAPYGYTDLMAIPKDMLGFDGLVSIAQRPGAEPSNLSADLTVIAKGRAAATGNRFGRSATRLRRQF